MRHLISVLILATCFVAKPTLAGPGHDHDHGHSHGSISQAAAIDKATKKVKQLVDKGKIDASWAKVSAANAEQKTYSKGPEWVVTFKNDQISDASKTTLYIFYSLDGHYLAANYTGN